MRCRVAVQASARCAPCLRYGCTGSVVGLPIVHSRWRPLEKSQRLQRCNLEALAAADIAAGHHVVAADHVWLGLGEAGPVAVVGIARQLSPLAPDDPIDRVIAWLAAVWADQGVGSLLIGFCKKIAFFHRTVNSQLSSRSKVFHTRGCHDETKSGEVLGNQGG